MSSHALPRKRRPFERVTLSHQFALSSALLMLVSMVFLGGWLSHQIEETAVARATAITGVYVESILADHLRDWNGSGPLPDALRRKLDQIFVLGPLHRKVTHFNLWDAQGRILYSNDARRIGLHFPVEGMLAKAFGGKVQAHLHGPTRVSAHAPELGQSERLLEVYAPIRGATRDRAIAVAEFYHATDRLGREIKTAQQRSWLVVALGAAAIYLALLGLVRRASATIIEQERALRSELAENQRMQARLRKAGARTTALNEKFLHRIAADLHDGPAQGIAFALMRFDEISLRYRQGEVPALRDALRTALDEIRSIAGGLALPGIADLSVAETARRAVADGERLWKKTVAADIDPALGDAPLAVKITLYRLIQESLANSWRHAPDGDPHLRVSGDADFLEISIDDSGGGFNADLLDQTITGSAGFNAGTPTSGRLGLTFMRERVRLLNGTFKLDSTPGKGTCIRVRIPLTQAHETHD